MLSLISAGTLRTPGFAFGYRGAHVVDVPMTLAVLKRADGTVLLVDAGLSAAEIARPIAAMGAHGLLFQIPGGADQSAVAQLSHLGVAPSDVKTIVATHLHLDHIGGFVDFPDAEIVVAASELAAARRLGKSAGYLHTDRLLRSGRLRPVLLDATPRHGFPSHLDLLGDGQVVLLDARGHTAGNVGVLLTDPTSGRRLLHAGDAAYAAHEFRERRISFFARFTRFREDWLRETWGHLQAFEAANSEIPVILSHDPAALSSFPD